MAWELGQGLERGLLPAMEAARRRSQIRVVWGPPLLALLLAAGALLTWRTGFFPVRQAPAIAQNTLLALLRGDPQARQSGQGSLSQFPSPVHPPWPPPSAPATSPEWRRRWRQGGRARCCGCGSAPCWACPSNTPKPPWRCATADAARKAGGKAAPCTTWRPASRADWPPGRGLACAFALFCALAALGIGNMTQANSLARRPEKRIRPTSRPHRRGGGGAGGRSRPQGDGGGGPVDRTPGALHGRLLYRRLPGHPGHEPPPDSPHVFLHPGKRLRPARRGGRRRRRGPWAGQR